MAAGEPPLSRALLGLCACLGRPPSAPRTPAGCAELLQALVAWATPESGSEKKAPARAAAALRASLLLLEAVKAESRGGGHVTGAAKAGRAVTSEESGRAGSSSLPAEEREEKGAPDGAGGPKCAEQGKDLPLLQGVTLSPEADVTLEAPDSDGGAHTAGEGQEEEEPVSELLAPQCVLRCAAAPLLLLCGAHIQDTPWSDAPARRLASQLLRSLLEACRCTSVGELLKGHQEAPYRTFREALELLGPRLRKDTWERHPDARLVFSWLLLRVPRPWLSDFLSRVMPPSLLFSDDYKVENKVLGIHCLHHIINNVPAAELRQYNRALVVYHALRNHLHAPDAEVIEAVLPCLLDLFPVLHKPSPALGTYQKDGENPSDQVMQLVLTHMEMEHKIALRRLYARSLPALQERLGARIVRHMKRLLRVIVGYLEIYDGPEEAARLSILETLQGTIKYAWPRIPPRLPLLLKALVKLIYEVSSEANQNSAPVTQALLSGATECLLLLDRCSKGQVKSALRGLPSVCTEPLLLQCVNRVLQSA